MDIAANCEGGAKKTMKDFIYCFRFLFCSLVLAFSSACNAVGLLERSSISGVKEQTYELSESKESGGISYIWEDNELIVLCNGRAKQLRLLTSFKPKSDGFEKLFLRVLSFDCQCYENNKDWAGQLASSIYDAYVEIQKKWSSDDASITIDFLESFPPDHRASFYDSLREKLSILSEEEAPLGYEEFTEMILGSLRHDWIDYLKKELEIRFNQNIYFWGPDMFSIEREHLGKQWREILKLNDLGLMRGVLDFSFSVKGIPKSKTTAFRNGCVLTVGTDQTPREDEKNKNTGVDSVEKSNDVRYKLKSAVIKVWHDDDGTSAEYLLSSFRFLPKMDEMKVLLFKCEEYKGKEDWARKLARGIFKTYLKLNSEGYVNIKEIGISHDAFPPEVRMLVRHALRKKMSAMTGRGEGGAPEELLAVVQESLGGWLECFEKELEAQFRRKVLLSRTETDMTQFEHPQTTWKKLSETFILNPDALTYGFYLEEIEDVPKVLGSFFGYRVPDGWICKRRHALFMARRIMLALFMPLKSTKPIQS